MIIFLGNDELYRDMIEDSKDDRDIVVSCQYRHLVPKSLIDSFTCVNIHYGSLPYFAGCNPIYWQIMKGHTAGVTLHYMDENFDSGDIIDMWECPIGSMNADELYEVLARHGKELFKKHYKGILNNTAPRKKQDLTFRSYHNKRDVDFSKEKNCSILDDRRIRAVHFKGKQYPTIEVSGRKYDLVCCDASL
jgi:methionyl-tRNA formyltransferase